MESIRSAFHSEAHSHSPNLAMERTSFGTQIFMHNAPNEQLTLTRAVIMESYNALIWAFASVSHNAFASYTIMRYYATISPFALCTHPFGGLSYWCKRCRTSGHRRSPRLSRREQHSAKSEVRMMLFALKHNIRLRLHRMRIECIQQIFNYGSEDLHKYPCKMIKFHSWIPHWMKHYFDIEVPRQRVPIQH